jgi:hypothetical protein
MKIAVLPDRPREEPTSAWSLRFATVVLLLHMPTVSSMADVAQEVEGARIDELGGDLGHPGICLVVLLVSKSSIYKPPGMTRYGWRKKQKPRAPSRP